MGCSGSNCVPGEHPGLQLHPADLLPVSVDKPELRLLLSVRQGAHGAGGHPVGYRLKQGTLPAVRPEQRHRPDSVPPW